MTFIWIINFFSLFDFFVVWIINDLFVSLWQRNMDIWQQLQYQESHETKSILTSLSFTYNISYEIYVVLNTYEHQSTIDTVI